MKLTILPLTFLLLLNQSLFGDTRTNQLPIINSSIFFAFDYPAENKQVQLLEKGQSEIFELTVELERARKVLKQEEMHGETLSSCFQADLKVKALEATLLEKCLKRILLLAALIDSGSVRTPSEKIISIIRTEHRLKEKHFTLKEGVPTGFVEFIDSHGEAFAEADPGQKREVFRFSLNYTNNKPKSPLEELAKIIKKPFSLNQKAIETMEDFMTYESERYQSLELFYQEHKETFNRLKSSSPPNYLLNPFDMIGFLHLAVQQQKNFEFPQHKIIDNLSTFQEMMTELQKSQSLNPDEILALFANTLPKNLNDLDQEGSCFQLSVNYIVPS